MVFSATFNNISVISRLSALLMEETGGPGDNINTLFYDNSNISDTNNNNKNFLIVQDFILQTKKYIHYFRLLKYKVVPGPTHNVYAVLHMSIKQCYIVYIHFCLLFCSLTLFMLYAFMAHVNQTVLYCLYTFLHIVLSIIINKLFSGEELTRIVQALSVSDSLRLNVATSGSHSSQLRLIPYLHHTLSVLR